MSIYEPVPRGARRPVRRLVRRIIYALIPGANPYVPIREIIWKIRPRK